MELNIIDIEKESYSGNDNTGKRLNEYKIQFTIHQAPLFKLVATNRGSAYYMLSPNVGWIRLKNFKDFDHYSNDKDTFIKEACMYLARLHQVSDFYDLFIKEINKYENS